MKIEKISERQIRCTLSKKDLNDRELRLSELAYGTEKAKELFRDMMQQASYELGFEADDIPLMIEAIPVSNECLVLVVTKVEDPDELDTRFSKFTEDVSENYSDEDDEDDEDYICSDEIVDCFGKIDDLIDTSSDEDTFVPLPKTIGQNKNNIVSDDFDEQKKDIQIKRVFSFTSLEDIIKVSSIIASNFDGDSSLYKNPVTSTYFLSISKCSDKHEEFNRMCSIISEYGKLEKTSYASLYYFDEHYNTIIKDDAINILSNM